jgi:DNA ligase-associated metallophosphoesterase
MAPPVALPHGAAELALPWPEPARLWLLPQRAAFDPDRALLLVADAHFGKAQSFRRLGVPVPGGTTQQALARLDAALDATEAAHIVFLGDLLHSRHAQAADAMAALRQWRLGKPDLELTLVRGNHDDHAGDPPADLGVHCVDGPLCIGPWALLHEPQPVPGAWALAGHVHPGVVIGGRANDRLRLPSFRFASAADGGLGLLPAFGEFTGLHVPARQADERVFAIAEHRVLAV